MQERINREGLEERVIVDSAGTGDWHIGSHPDPRAIAAAKARGYAIDELVARQVTPDDFQRFDYILCMDRNNLKALRAMCPANLQSRLHLFLEFAKSSHETVPDPYYSGAQGFELVLDLVEDACEGLLEHVRREHFS
jgi:protein-tyrosine phosphatase